MAKIDEIKETIGFYKAIFITLLVIDSSLIAWIFKNYNINKTKMYIVLFVIVCLSIFLGFLFIKILEKIKQLRDM